MSGKIEIASGTEQAKSPVYIWWMLATLIGMVIGSGLYFGIKDRSVQSGLSIVYIQLFFLVPAYCWILRDHPRPIWKRVSKWVVRLWWVFLVCQIALLAERIWWNNGDSYPTWLATRATVTPEQTEYMFADRSLCGTRFLGAFVTKSNEVFVRCGQDWRPGNTYWIENYRDASKRVHHPEQPPEQESKQ